MREDISLLVCSCDSYSDLWDPFFQMLHIQWPDCPLKIYLNTESNSYATPYYDVNLIHSSEKNIDWSDRLINALNKIDTKYVLFTLEDFYFLETVDNNAFDRLIKKIDSIKDFAFLDFTHMGNTKTYIKKLDLYKVWKYGEFKITATMAIWNRQALLDLLIPGESPWEFEPNASKRSMKTNYGIYRIGKEHVLKTSGLYGIEKKRWRKPTVELFEKYKVEVDFDKRGFCEHPVDLSAPLPKSFGNRVYMFMISNRITCTLMHWRVWMPDRIMLAGARVKRLFSRKK